MMVIAPRMSPLAIIAGVSSTGTPARKRIQREDHEQAAKRDLLRRQVQVPTITTRDSAEVLRSSKDAPAE
jgi:hypothetical protein